MAIEVLEYFELRSSSFESSPELKIVTLSGLLSSCFSEDFRDANTIGNPI